MGCSAHPGSREGQPALPVLCFRLCMIVKEADWDSRGVFYCLTSWLDSPQLLSPRGMHQVKDCISSSVYASTWRQTRAQGEDFESSRERPVCAVRSFIRHLREDLIGPVPKARGLKGAGEKRAAGVVL